VQGLRLARPVFPSDRYSAIVREDEAVRPGLGGPAGVPDRRRVPSSAPVLAQTPVRSGDFRRDTLKARLLQIEATIQPKDIGR
jgi:hypothetical protein